VDIRDERPLLHNQKIPMTDVLTNFFDTLGGGAGTGHHFFIGLLSLFITALIVLILIDPITE